MESLPFLVKHFQDLAAEKWAEDNLNLGCQNRACNLAQTVFTMDRVDTARIQLMQIVASDKPLTLKARRDTSWDRLHEVLVVDDLVFDPLHGVVCPVDTYLMEAFVGMSFSPNSKEVNYYPYY